MHLLTSNGSFSLKHTPERSCIACRERSPQDELVRFILIADKAAIVTHSSMISGRSAYLCPREKCFDALAKRGRFEFARGKHNRLSVKLDDTEWFILKNKFMNFIRERGLGRAG